ncbi:MAG: universal stress protein [Anaerolineales bacterium]|nr:universal stress protein [Anaerolineales bacterium]
MKILYLVPNQEMSPITTRFAARVATRIGAGVDVLVVSPDQEVLERAEATLASSKENFSTVPLTAEFIAGDPLAAFEQALQKDNYELLLIRVNRRKHLIPTPFRFMINKIIKRSPIPILMVRQTSEDLNHMLVCTGGLEKSEPVVALSARLASQAGLHASLLTVSTAVPSMYTGMEEMEETIEEMLETETPLARHLRRCASLLTEKGIDAEIKVRHGDVVEAILEETASGKYDLIVLGSSESWTLQGLLLGNVTQQIINRAPCAVLVVKHLVE